MTQERTIAWSDRHKGIGADGLVLIGRSELPEADYTMRIYNADSNVESVTVDMGEPRLNVPEQFVPVAINLPGHLQKRVYSLLQVTRFFRL